MISVEAKNHGHVRDIINWCTEALTDNQEPQGLDGAMDSAKVVLIADYWRPGWRTGGPIVSLGRLVDHTRARTWVVTRDHDWVSPIRTWSLMTWVRGVFPWRP